MVRRLPNRLIGEYTRDFSKRLFHSFGKILLIILCDGILNKGIDKWINEYSKFTSDIFGKPDKLCRTSFIKQKYLPEITGILINLWISNSIKNCYCQHFCQNFIWQRGLGKPWMFVNAFACERFRPHKLKICTYWFIWQSFNHHIQL